MHLQLAGVRLYIFFFGNSGQRLSDMSLCLQLHLCIAIILVDGKWLELLHHRHHIRFFGADIAYVLNVTKTLEKTQTWVHVTMCLCVCVCECWVSKKEERIITTVLVTAGEQTSVAVSPARFPTGKNPVTWVSRAVVRSRSLCCCCWFAVRAFWWLPSPFLFLPLKHTHTLRMCKCVIAFQCLFALAFTSFFVSLLFVQGPCCFIIVVVEKTRARCISRLVSQLGAH